MRCSATRGCDAVRFLISSCIACAAALFVAGCGRSAGSLPKASGNVAKAAVTAVPLPKPPQAKYQRDLYRKLDECVADWGFAGKCTPLAADAPERAQGGAFLGPIYSDALRFESQLTARREAVEQGYQSQLDENPSNKAIASAEIKS
jgi:hypothetical protein